MYLNVLSSVALFRKIISQYLSYPHNLTLSLHGLAIDYTTRTKCERDHESSVLRTNKSQHIFSEWVRRLKHTGLKIRIIFSISRRKSYFFKICRQLQITGCVFVCICTCRTLSYTYACEYVYIQPYMCAWLCIYVYVVLYVVIKNVLRELRGWYDARICA